MPWLSGYMCLQPLLSVLFPPCYYHVGSGKECSRRKGGKIVYTLLEVGKVPLKRLEFCPFLKSELQKVWEIPDRLRIEFLHLKNQEIGKDTLWKLVPEKNLLRTYEQPPFPQLEKILLSSEDPAQPKRNIFLKESYSVKEEKGVHVWELMYTRGGFMSMYAKTN